ncbi:Uncharacterized protein APZ42_005968 [Daphnia magna]|uniref:Uncharacterized protein n=1 Tax=Daphnia magna TaxID=35525 RepID=A0A164G5J0_9CRUS|nr:Uncharacterized protein APZ42_005968 [Daphnia magna]
MGVSDFQQLEGGCHTSRAVIDVRLLQTCGDSYQHLIYYFTYFMMGKNGDRQSLYGLLPLSKRLIIPTMEIIFTYLIIIYQFKAAAH